MSRMRNHSEITRGLSVKNGEAIMGSSSHTINMTLTPMASNHSKTNIFATNTMPSPQGKVIGKRYSRI